MRKYSKPSLRISPIWLCDTNTAFIYVVRGDGNVKALCLRHGGEWNSDSWHLPEAREPRWTPLLPLGQEPLLVIEPGRRYQTRDGRKAFVGYQRDGHEYPMVGHIVGGGVESWRDDGAWEIGEKTGADLVAETDAT